MYLRLCMFLCSYELYILFFCFVFFSHATSRATSWSTTSVKIAESKFWFVQYFTSWPDTCKTNEPQLDCVCANVSMLNMELQLLNIRMFVCWRVFEYRLKYRAVSIAVDWLAVAGMSSYQFSYNSNVFLWDRLTLSAISHNLSNLLWAVQPQAKYWTSLYPFFLLYIKRRSKCHLKLKYNHQDLFNFHFTVCTLIIA